MLSKPALSTLNSLLLEGTLGFERNNYLLKVPQGTKTYAFSVRLSIPPDIGATLKARLLQAVNRPCRVVGRLDRAPSRAFSVRLEHLEIAVPAKPEPASEPASL